MARKNAYAKKMLRNLDAEEKRLRKKKAELSEKLGRILDRAQVVEEQIKSVEERIDKNMDSWFKWKEWSRR